MTNLISRLMHRLFDRPCCECGEVEVPFYKRRCDFCSPGEGKMIDCAYLQFGYDCMCHLKKEEV